MGSHSFNMKCFLSGGIQKLHASLKLPAAEASSLRGVFRLPWSPWQRSSSGRPLWRKASSGLHPDQRKTGPVKGVLRLISVNTNCGIKLKVLKEYTERLKVNWDLIGSIIFDAMCYLEQKAVVDKQEKRNQERLKRREEREKEEKMRKRWAQTSDVWCVYAL